MCVRARNAFVVLLALVSGLAVPVSAEQTRWSRVYLPNSMAGTALEWALDGAVEWLENPSCRAVFSDFADDNGVPLDQQLAKLGVDEATYFEWVVFRDGSSMRQCDPPRRIMFTARGHRVVFVCKRRAEELWLADRRQLRAMVIHEVLHTLGLGENPPTSSEITARVIERCDRGDATVRSISSADSRASRLLRRAAQHP